MKQNPNDGIARRERRRASATLNTALDALHESQRFARVGDLATAERAARLSERHAKLAERLIDLKAALRRIATARYEAERQLNESFAERDAALKERELQVKIAEAGRSSRDQRDAEAARWQERLTHLKDKF